MERRARLVGGLIAAVALLRLVQMTRLHPIVWDELEYFRATDWVSRGLVPYRDFWEHHTPLQWFVFAPIAALIDSPGVSAIVALRWAQLPLWIAAFVLLAKWMRGAGASAAAAGVAVLLALCSSQFTLAAMEYRIDALACALYVAGLFLLQRGRGAGGGVALCLAGLSNIRLGPLIVATVLVSRRRWRAIAAGAATLAACAIYFVATGSAKLAFRGAWTENYLAGKYAQNPPLALLRRLGTPFGFALGGFDPASVDLATIVIYAAGVAGMIHVVVTRWRVRDDLFLLVPLQVVNVAFVAAIGYIYHYHFLIVTLLALPFAAHVCDLLLASGRARAAAAAVAACVTVGVFAAFFRGKEDEFDYQDVVMRDADRLVAPGARVFAGVAYALRREPACRTWFITERAFVFERAGIAAPCDVAADPPGAVILDVPMRHWLAAHPRQAEFVRRHYRPVWPELWLPAMNARLTPERPSTRWVVPADGVWVVRASAPIRLTIDGNPQPQSGTLTLRKRQRLEAAAESMQPTDVLIVPAGAPRQFRRPAPGVTLDAIAPPRTHVPRLW